MLENKNAIIYGGGGGIGGAVPKEFAEEGAPPLPGRRPPGEAEGAAR